MEKEIVTIVRNSIPTVGGQFDGAAGCISLSNGVDIWFSDIHPITTQYEAVDVANKILKALNN